MARSISSNLQTQIANDNNKIAFLLKFGFATPVRVSTHYSDVTYDSLNYEAGGNFVALEASPETGEVIVQQVNITMTNVSTDFRTLVQAGNYTDIPVDIYIAFFDNNESLVDATTYFSGKIKRATISENSKGSQITLEVANHWANWNLTKGRHYTDESQQQVYSGDKGLEYADQTKEDIRWGND